MNFEIKELDFMDRTVILARSVLWILSFSFTAAVLIYLTNLPKIIIYLVQNAIYDNLRLSVIWLSIIVFSMIVYILHELLKLIWVNIKDIHRLIENEIIKIVVSEKTIYLTRSSDIGAIIKDLESEDIYYNKEENES